MEPEPADGYSLSYLVERLGIIEEHVLEEFGRRRKLEVDDDDWRLRGVYVTQEAVERLLAQPVDRPVPVSTSMTALLGSIEAEATKLEEAGHRLRLRELIARCELDDLDAHVLLLAAAASIDPRFELVFGYLNDDVAQRNPTVGLALMLSGLSTTNADARARLSPEGRLVRLGLIEVHVDPARPALAWSISAPARVVSHLLGDDEPDPVLLGTSVPMPPLGGRTAERLRSAMESGVRVTYVHDQTMASAMSSAAAAADALGWPCLGFDITGLAEDAPTEAIVRAARREAVLNGALLVVGGVEELAGARRSTMEHLTAGPLQVIVCGRLPWAPSWASVSPLIMRAEHAASDDAVALWHLLLGDAADRIDVERSLAPLRLSPQQAVRAVETARQHALVEGRPLELPDLLVGVRSQNASGLQRLTRRVEPTASWDDLIVPAAVEDELRLMTIRWRHRHRVQGDWGMSSGAGRGRGVSGLFAGPSGTGKTLSAQVIAHDLGLDLYIVDLSTVVDKYIGETSKNLDRIFDQADRVNGVLLFDEADALFGKRSAVSDSKDRNANLEVAHLLQRMEAFDGVAILTTNLASNLDEAFLRRLDAIVDFPRPDAPLRARLWELALGPRTPRAADVDTTELGHRLKLAGGEIQNVALTASFRAVDRGEPVTMEGLMRAAIREHRKIQKRVTAIDLGPYAFLLDEA